LQFLRLRHLPFTPCCSSKLNILVDRLFFFQAEDGIRDLYVTGVQTCALPIYLSRKRRPSCAPTSGKIQLCMSSAMRTSIRNGVRSEERRVGKECRYRWSPYR